MQIEIIDIDLIKEYENNSKLHPQWQIEQIMRSIEEFGFNDPIAIDENNVIIEGHGRYLALKELGYREAQIIRLSHLNDNQKKAYTIAHNKLTINTDFDIDKLKYELNKLEAAEFDLKLLGFEEIEISELLELEKEEILELEDENTGDTEMKKHQLICPFCKNIGLKKEFKEVLTDGEDT